MEITGVIWLRNIVDKLADKHQVATDEVEEILARRPRGQRVARGRVAGEDVYSVIGQPSSGRYLIIFYVYKLTREALVISARDATSQERRRYGRK